MNDNKMTSKSTQRGQLKYEISTSSNHIEAGKIFSITVKISNPFDIPVTLNSVATKLPTEFIDVNKEKLKEQEKILEERMKKILKSKIPTVKIEEDHKRKVLTDLTRDLIRAMPFGSLFTAGLSAANYIKASSMTASTMYDQVIDSVSTDEIQNIIDEVEKDEKPQIKLKERLITTLDKKIQNLKDNLQKPIVLQPNNSSVQIFTLRTSSATFFRPSNYSFHIEIGYETDDKQQRDVVDYSLSISSSIKTLMFGAGVGSAIGYFVKDIFNDKTIFTLLSSGGSQSAVSYIIVLLANIILGMVAVIVFSRKKDIQPLISIEDFWGAILIGFILGYTGKVFLEGILPAN